MTLTQVAPPPTDVEPDLISGLRTLYSEAKKEHNKFHAGWRRNYLLTNNRQTAMDSTQPWSANISVSEVWPILSSRVGWMTDQQLRFTVAPAAAPGALFVDHQQVLSEQLEQIMDMLWKVNCWDTEIVTMLWDAAQFGAGILKACWDSGLDAGLGNVSIRRIDPWAFYPDPNCTSLDDAQYMIEVNRMTVAEIQRRYPSTSAAVLEDAMLFGESSEEIRRPLPFQQGSYPMANPGNLPGSNSTVWGLPGQTDITAGDVLNQGVDVYECWLRENYTEDREPTDPSHGPEDEPVVYDRWRVVVFAGNVVLLDEYAENLWEHDRHPYERYVDEETGEFFPSSIVHHLAPCQIAINRLLASIQGNAELIGNPIFMDIAGSGLERTQVVNRPGQRLTTSKNSANANTRPDWLKPPEMPAYIPNQIQYYITRMENISGLSGVSKGQSPQGRQASQTVQATQEAGFVRIRSSLRNLETCLSRIGNLCANLIIQNYTTPRIMSIVGDDGQSSALRLAANHFYMPGGADGPTPLKFSLIVSAGSNNPTSRQSRIAEADALFAMHAIDRQAVLQTHAFPHWQDIEKRMEQKEAAAAQAAQQQHQQPHGPGTGHEH